MTIDKAKVKKVASVLRMVFVIGLMVIYGSMKLHHYRHPELWELAENKTYLNPYDKLEGIEFTTGLETECECQSDVVMHTIIGWLNIWRWYIGFSAVLFIVIYFLEHPEILFKIKNIGSDE